MQAYERPYGATFPPDRQRNNTRELAQSIVGGLLIRVTLIPRVFFLVSPQTNWASSYWRGRHTVSPVSTVSNCDLLHSLIFVSRIRVTVRSAAFPINECALSADQWSSQCLPVKVSRVLTSLSSDGVICERKKKTAEGSVQPLLGSWVRSE